MNDYKLTYHVSINSTLIVLTEHNVISADIHWHIVLIIELCWLKPNTAHNNYYPQCSMSFYHILTNQKPVYIIWLIRKDYPTATWLDSDPSITMWCTCGIMWLTILSYLMIRDFNTEKQNWLCVHDIYYLKGLISIIFHLRLLKKVTEGNKLA